MFALAPTMSTLNPHKPHNPTSSLSPSEISDFKSSLDGTVVVKGESSNEEYEAAIERWNHVYSKEAHIVAVPETEEDVSKIIKFVRKHNLDVAVAGGRHSFHGASSTEGGLCMDLQKLRKVQIDKDAKTVTAGGGCKAEDIEVPAEKEGLQVVFGAANDTGIGGFTTGGGIGWLSGQYGLACDNLISARVALASGEIVVANDKENSDLFWGIRGGGSNFGICTEFTFKAHPCKQEGGMVYTAMFLYPRSLYPQLLSLANKLYFSAVIPSGGRLSLMVSFIRLPGAPSHVPGFLAFYDGPESEANELLKPLHDMSPTGVMAAGMKPYSSFTALAERFPAGEFNRYATNSAQMDYPIYEDVALAGLEYFEAVCTRIGDRAARSKFMVECRQGACATVKDITATAYSARHPLAASIGAEFQWADPSLDQEMRSEAKKLADLIKGGVQEKRDANAEVNGEQINGGLTKLGNGTESMNGGKKEKEKKWTRDVGSVHANFSTGDEKVSKIFGENLPRMRELKKKFDPECMWDKWYFVSPEEEEEA